MLLPAVSLLAILLALYLRRTPHAVLRRYASSFRRRHGTSLQISLAVLASACFSGIVASVVHPGHPLGEAVIGAVLAVIALAGVLDLRRFRRQAQAPARSAPR